MERIVEKAKQERQVWEVIREKKKRKQINKNIEIRKWEEY